VYPLGGSPWSRFRHALNRGVGLQGVRALHDVSFKVHQGEAFGIIGTNGSGKSTLLQMVAGILRPTAGEVTVNGRLSALLELGSGFAPEFTGRQNVFLNASILGLTQEEISARFETIEKFASIGDFIDQPIRTYSSGMVLRLAFAVVAHVDPEVLIVDEALAVGDIAFRQRCMRRIHDLRAQGVTILFVSHDTGDVKALCERCLWLERGAVKMLGETDEVVGAYLSAAMLSDSAPEKVDRAVRATEAVAATRDSYAGKHRFGNGRAAVTEVSLLTPEGQPMTCWKAGAIAVIRVGWKAVADVASPIAGYLVRNEKGETIFGTNTARENCPLPEMKAGDTDSADFHLTLPELAPAEYFISGAVSEGERDRFEVCDYIENALTVATVAGGREIPGYLHLRCAGVTVHRHEG
jgi:lipopolysaccharide transport system ATP-binding protein